MGCVKNLQRITKGVCFESQLKTSTSKQNLLSTILRGNAINVTIKSLFSYIPIIIPSLQIQLKFNGSISRSFTLSFDSWTTGRKPVNGGEEYQLDIASPSNVNSPLYLVAVHQQAERENPARPLNQYNKAIYDNVDLGKYFVEIDDIRYSTDPSVFNYSENNNLVDMVILVYFIKNTLENR